MEPLNTSVVDAAARRTRVAVAAIVAIAFILRVVYVLESRSSPLFDAPIMDAKYHVDWASAFARGEDFQPGPFFRAPLYPWFLGVCFELFGRDLLIPRLIQAGFGAVTTWLTYLIGARAFDRRVGLIASIATAFSWILVFYDGELLLESLSIPLNLAALWFTLGANASSKPVRWGVAGAAFGLAAITRPNVLLVAIGVALWIGWTRRSARRAAITSCGAFVVGLALPILPLTIYNATVGRDRVLISSQAGVNLWIGNNPESDGSSAIVPGTREDWWGGYRDSIALAESAAGRSLKPSEVSSFYTAKSIHFWRNDTSRALSLLLKKLRLFWTDWEIGNNEEPRFFAHRFAPISKFLPYSFAIFGALAVVGVGVSLRGRGRAPLIIFAIGYSASVVVFFVCSRYRAPIVPILAIFAARAALWIVEAVHSRARLELAVAGLAVAASLAVSFSPPAGLRRSDASGLWMLGVIAATAGDHAGAVLDYRQSLELEPNNYLVLRALAQSLRSLGKKDEAKVAYQSALAAHQDDASALDGLADLELELGTRDEAARLAERTIATAPFDPRGYYTLGRTRYAAGDLRGAAQQFEEALTHDPHHFGAAYSLARAQQEQARTNEAIDAFRRALAIDSGAEQRAFRRDAFARLAGLLAARGDAAGALAELDRSLLEFPNDPALVELRSRVAAAR